eukprot:TRINITY_DN18209_c0_g1_i1.p1 TRINITY_DN18209_c0_g1~~TRINITY_DN18209_c0_g1_i1.p1  ORF type:complete len:164 (-),score=38.73 TRINITY_DN18209_c0_g1_i1:139-630(-)
MCIRDSIKTLPPFQAVLLLQLGPVLLYKLLRVAFERYKSRATPQDLKSWSEVASSSRKELLMVEPLTVPYASYLGMLGVMSGLALASPFVKRYPLALPTSVVTSIARFVLGNAGLFALFLSIRAVEKSQSNESTIGVLRYCRYGSMPPYILLGAPLLFRKLGL